MWNAVTHAFNKILDSDPDLAVAVAAITILTEVIKVSKGTCAQFFTINTRKEQIAVACAVVCVRETKTFLCAAHTMYEVQLELKEAAYQLQECRYLHSAFALQR